MTLRTQFSVDDSDIDNLTRKLRKSNEAIGFRPQKHPVRYDAAIVDEERNAVRELPTTRDWPPDPAEMVPRLQQLPNDPNAPFHNLHCGFRNPSKSRYAYVWASPMFFRHPTTDKHVPMPDDPRYSVGYGQRIARVRLENLQHTTSLLMPALAASKAEPVHAIWSGGQRAPNPGGPGDLMNCTFDTMPLTEGEPLALLALVLFIWDRIESEPRLHLENGRTEFRLVIIDRPPDEFTTDQPVYPNLPIPHDAFELMSVFVSQPVAGRPHASMHTDISLAWGWPQPETAKLIAGILAEIAPFGFATQKEFSEAVAHHHRE